MDPAPKRRLLEGAIKNEPFEEKHNVIVNSAAMDCASNRTLLQNQIKTERMEEDPVTGSAAQSASNSRLLAVKIEPSEEPAKDPMQVPALEAAVQPVAVEEPDIIFLAKHEPESVRRDHLVKLLIGEHTQLSTRHAVQALLPDPAYFESALNARGNEYRMIIPEEIDAWAVSVILMAALNEGVPVNIKSTKNGLTLHKLHKAAAFVKVDGNKIGLPAVGNEKAQGDVPSTGDIIQDISEGIELAKNPPHAVLKPPAAVQPPAKPLELWELQYQLSEVLGKPDFLELSFATIRELLQKNFLKVYSELIVYEAVLKWCKHSYPTRWTKDICEALFVEIRWDLLEGKLDEVITAETAPLRDTLQSLKTTLFPAGRRTVKPRERHFTQSLYLLFADGNQSNLARHDWETHVDFTNVRPPQEMLYWTPYCEIVPGWNGHLLVFRLVCGRYLKTYSYDLKSKTVRYLFEQPGDTGEGCPFVCLNGTIYAWSPKGKQSVKFHSQHSAITHDLKKPKSFRKEAASASCNGKFYYCGGALLQDKSGAAVATVEVFDAGKNQWSALPNMRKPRRCFAALVCNGFLYVTGGACNESPGILATCERLNLSGTGAGWEVIGGLCEPRYSHFMFDIDGQVHVGGGCASRGKCADWMERYDVKHRGWIRLAVKLGSTWMSCVNLTRDNNFSL